MDALELRAVGVDFTWASTGVALAMTVEGGVHCCLHYPCCCPMCLAPFGHIRTVARTNSCAVLDPLGDALHLSLVAMVQGPCGGAKVYQSLWNGARGGDCWDTNQCVSLHFDLV